MPDEIKIHAYTIETGRRSESFDEIIEIVSSDTLDARTRDVNFSQIRAEDVQETSDFRFVDFIRMRGTHGPGKASEQLAVSGFSFNPGEFFAEETALLYDASLNTVFIQYNHHGVRAGSISEYFSAYTNNPESSIKFLPKLRRDAERRLRSKSIFKSIDILVAPATLQSSDNELSVNSALAILAQSSGAQKIEITLRAKRGKNESLDWRNANNIINWIREKIPSGAISTARIQAKENADSDIELIDLLADRLCSTHPINVGPDLRWPRQQRYNALVAARNRLFGLL
ncbi:hypothetical protein HF925_01635 [Acidithiobacillus ferriphilus]|uniref:DUF6731 family protein n=1 Tax=Acidithiobacillus ferriphilus TaxID=1689834 RepID=UPI001C068B34|nr:DUF6731 family protein [Acidithiobacillus ferriphilus]MBU2847300.1 hypothetical protein [Acidithiobacillus ferriphilus]